MMTIEEIVNLHRKGKCCCINLIARKRQCAGAKFLSGKIPAEEAVRLAAAEKTIWKRKKVMHLCKLLNCCHIQMTTV